MKNIASFITESIIAENTSINEADVKSEKDFKEYANKLLKQAHDDSFDQSIADKVADDLLKAHGEDYGAAIGALQSGMGK